jgi:hypothetical protein
MNLNDYAVEITRVGNGYICRFPRDEGDPGWAAEVITDDEMDDLLSGQELLWWVLDYFALSGSRHDKERLTIRREPGDKYPYPSSDDTEE